MSDYEQNLSERVAATLRKQRPGLDVGALTRFWAGTRASPTGSRPVRDRWS